MIVDVHCHLGRSPQFRFPDTSVGTMLRVMDRLGIDRAVCCHLAFLHGERGDWDARDAVQFLIDIIDESPGAVLDQVHERKYFAECAPAFVQETDPKSIVIVCSRILGRMEEATEQARGRVRS